jgi:membrane carboxypeptidase/penicillin-binding protein
MTDSLIGVMDKGTARNLRLDNTISAGKTGTSNDKKDGWFVGYTPYYTTSVWVGYDLPQTVDGLSGSTYPGAIWKDYMNTIHTLAMNKSFNKQ